MERRWREVENLSSKLVPKRTQRAGKQKQISLIVLLYATTTTTIHSSHYQPPKSKAWSHPVKVNKKSTEI